MVSSVDCGVSPRFGMYKIGASGSNGVANEDSTGVDLAVHGALAGLGCILGCRFGDCSRCTQF